MPETPSRLRRRLVFSAQALAGVVLPALTLAVEATMQLCAEILFDPIPSGMHVALVAAVPLAGAWGLFALDRSTGRRVETARFAVGLAAAVSASYAIAFLPLVPIAAIAVLYFGLGLLPLAPLFALLSLIALWHRLGRAAVAPPKRWTPWWGVAVGLLLLAAADLPALSTRYGLSLATSGDVETRAAGLRWLRSFGSERRILEACWRRPSGAWDLFGLALSFTDPVSPEAARKAYYRVTGRSFDSEPMPGVFGEHGRWRAAFDPDVGGEVVGREQSALSIAASRIDGSIDAAGAVAYLEWTLVFRNDSHRPREGRLEMRLPDGAVASRATLWVEGEPREAAFASRSQARRAYSSVVRQRRDPLLVTTRGPGRLLVQCFPVPARGEMKIRVGITAPLRSLDAGAWELRMPHLVARNAALPEGHAVWLESARRIEGLDSEWRLERVSGDEGVALRSHFDDAGLAEARVRLARPASALGVWSRDPLDDSTVLRRRLESVPVAAPTRVVFVVEASVGMAPAIEALAEWIDAVDLPIELGLVVASDRSEVVVAPRHAAAAALADALAATATLGGVDAAPALVLAWDLAARAERGAVVWVRGKQPVALASLEALRQRFERRPQGPRIYAVATTLGVHRVASGLGDELAVVAVERRASLSQDLGALFATWRRGEVSQLVFDRLPLATTEETLGEQTSDHLARLWAASEVERLRRAGEIEAAVALAVDYQLVTPVTGAVVLETAAQYDEHGLEPVAAGSVPTIPEPETWALLAIVFLTLAFRRQKAAVACRA